MPKPYAQNVIEICFYKCLSYLALASVSYKRRPTYPRNITFKSCNNSCHAITGI